MSIQQYFNKFDKNIYLTNQSAGYREASEKDKSILQAIKTAFDDAGYPVIDSFCQGSFAVDTAIVSLKGDFDIDRALVIDETKAPENPIDPKKIVRDVLSCRNFKNPEIKKPCVTANYLSKNLHIDYTVYSWDGYSYKLAVGKEHAAAPEWSPSDTKGLIEWINNKEKYGLNPINKNKQFKRLVRYMKRWRDENFTDEAIRKKVFSIGLTIMLKEQYKPDYFSDSVEDDLTVLNKTIDNILRGSYIRNEVNNGKRLSVRLPKAPYRDIFQHKSDGISYDGSDLAVGSQFYNKLTKLQTELQKALNETDLVKQCTILNGVFGKDFEIPETSNNSASGVKKAALAATSLFATAGASGTSQGA